MTLPKGWTNATLGEFTVERVEQGEPGERPVRYIDIGSVDRDSKRVGPAEMVTRANAPTRARQWVKPGDVLVSLTRPNLNAVALVTAELDGSVASTGFHVLRSRGILPEWIFNRVRSQEFVADVCKGVQGVVYPAIRPADVRRHELPIPPVQEQRRIVDIIDSYLTRLDDAVANLRRAAAKLKAYQTSVLKAAVEGRLVQTEASIARAENRDHEQAAALLDRVLKERRRRWEQAELAKLQVAGKKPKDDRWKRRYRDARPVSIFELGESAQTLPEGWCWASLGQMAWSVKDGPHYSPKYAKEGVPFITGGQVRPWGVDFDHAKRISGELHRELSVRVKPQLGDLLYTKGGTTGIARVNTYEREFSVWVHVAVLKLTGLVNPFYLQHALNSPWCYAQAQRFTHGVGNQDLGLTRMVGIVFPLPPRSEQDRIVEEVDRLDSIAREVATLVEKQLQRARQLRQAVLKWGFDGKLVDQDPHDEPADRLLTRIKAERDGARPAERRPAHRARGAK